MTELRERILAAKDIASERIHVEAWGVDVEVRGMSGRARAAFVQQALGDGTVNLAMAYPLLVAECCFDPETGQRIFTTADLEALSEKSGDALEQIALVAGRLSGLDDAAVERSKSESQE